MSTPFEPGERALLLDDRGRRYLITLRVGAQFHSHRGTVDHDAILGSPEGVRLRTTMGMPLVAFRPSLADFVLKMPRGAQVIYPKDLGHILVFADVAPGHTVLEAGTGSGGLTLALVRAVGERGRVISYERRADFHGRARENIEAFLGKIPATLDLRLGDIADGIPEREVDRVVLDVAEPWSVIPVVRQALRPGGIFCFYLPTVLQVHQTVVALEETGGFTEIATTETLLRPWHVERVSMRPDHRMVAHTGFVTTARHLGLEA